MYGPKLAETETKVTKQAKIIKQDKEEWNTTIYVHPVRPKTALRLNEKDLSNSLSTSSS